MIGDEAARAFDRVSGYAAFAQRLVDNRKGVADALKEARAANPGCRVVGYGASVGTLTLLQFYGLSSDIPVIYDDNPLQDALISSRSRIAIEKSDAMYAAKPDVVILFAWRYRDAIIGRHEQFLSQGGRFLIPLPDVRWFAASDVKK